MNVQDLKTLSFEQLVGAGVVLLVLIFIYNAAMTAWKNYQEEKRRRKQPVTSLERIVQEHEERLKRDYNRLNELENGNRIMMRAMMAMLSHEINGNSDDKLRFSYDEIQQFLIDR